MRLRLRIRMEKGWRKDEKGVGKGRSAAFSLLRVIHRRQIRALRRSSSDNARLPCFSPGPSEGPSAFVSLSPRFLPVRLRQIKIAGFKSFADPTLIEIRDPFIAIVGPNGCGKSNIIDAVRWVLGEGRVSELRGQAMSQLIFAGSSRRKPLGRASVELVLDNSDHVVKGPWGQYEELSVRRVVTGEGLSAYYINHQQVRRRDVQEIFLGTGLGPRSYAIVSQGTIGRFTSAKPEEIRVYLEEAAGVSLYRERRRETETHLRQTRENLEHAADLQAVRGEEIERLRAEAATAARWKELDARKTESENLWYFLQCETARSEADEAAAAIARVENEIAQKRAALTECEGAQESVDADVRRADAEHERIAADFRNAEKELARLEGEMSRIVERRRVAERDEAQAERTIGEKTLALEEAVNRMEASAGRIEALEEALIEFEAMNEDRAAKLEAAEAAEASAMAAAREAGGALAAARTALEVEDTKLREERRREGELAARIARVGADLGKVPQADPARVEELAERLEEARADEEECAAAAEEAAERADAAREAAAEAGEAYFAALSEFKSLSARLTALEDVQKSATDSDALTAWLASFGVDGLPELADEIDVPKDWMTALEAALEHRTRAFLLRDLRAAADFARRRPPARLSFAESAGSGGEAPSAGLLSSLRIGDAPARPLRSVITARHPAAAAALDDWTANVALVEDFGTALRARAGLPDGGTLVTPAGDVVTRHAVTFWAAEDPRLALLSRGREIRELRERVESMDGRVAELDDARTAASAAERRTREAMEAARAKASEAARRAARLTLEEREARSALAEAVRRAADLRKSREELEGEREETAARMEELAASIEELAERLDAAERAAGSAAAAHAREQDRLIELRREETETIHRTAMKRMEIEQARASRVEDERRIGEIKADIAREAARRDEARKSLAAEDKGALEKGAAELLEKSGELERAAADAQERLALARRRSDENRRLAKSLSDAIIPLTESLGTLRATAAQKTALLTQLSDRMRELGADWERLAVLAQERGMKAPAVKSEVTRLMNEIASLGPVNHAALAQLEEKEKAMSLAAEQMEDLQKAVETLEAAIRRIDMETRARMRETFAKVNANFMETFRVLFGGGDASLTIVGEEILDAGVEVRAHPPGKKNQTLTQLSGGEQTLTAIALIFSMFRLNPAPFCLLDEVDAPLDEANQGRLARLCRGMSEATQFILITHNRVTMEHASALIGVTMKEPGVSRVVSVDIAEAVELAAKKKGADGTNGTAGGSADRAQEPSGG